MTSAVPIPLQFTDAKGQLTAQGRQAWYKVAELLNSQQPGILPEFFNFTVTGGTPFAIVYLDGNGLPVTGPALSNAQILVGQTGTIPIAGSLAGTLNRLSLSYSLGTFTFNISPSYVGQGSITTLGTIALGTWNGSAIGAQYGGTGLTAYTVGDIIYANGATSLTRIALGTANQVLGVNNGGTAPEYKSLLGTANRVTVNHAAGSVTFTAPQDLATTSNVTFGTVTSTGAFGCNGKTAQTAATVNGAVGGTAGATYTAAEQAILNNAVALLNQIRTALINDGVAV